MRVGACTLELLGEVLRLFQDDEAVVVAQAGIHFLHGVDERQHGEVGAALGLDLLHDLLEKANPVLVVLGPVLVVAEVAAPREELVQHVGGRALHLDAVEPGLLEPEGGLPAVLDDGLDLFVRVVVDLRDGGKRGAQPELHAYIGARLMDAVGHLAPFGRALLAWLRPVRQPEGAQGGGFQDDQARSAVGDEAVVVERVLAHFRGALRHGVRPCGGLDDAVLQVHGAYRDGAEDGRHVPRIAVVGVVLGVEDALRALNRRLGLAGFSVRPFLCGRRGGAAPRKRQGGSGRCANGGKGRASHEASP